MLSIHRISVASAKQRGFTLIELMVTVAIVAILSSVAVPSYIDYVRRGTLPEASNRLSVYASRMEQYFQDNRNYGTAGCANVNTPSGLVFPSNAAGNQKFTYSCNVTNGGQGFLITATGTTKPALGHDYTIDHVGNQTTVSFKGSTSGKNCWVMRGSEC